MKGEFFRPCPKCGKICNAELDMCEICSGKIAKPEPPKPTIPVAPVVTPVIEPVVEEIAPTIEETVEVEVVEEVATERDAIEEITLEESQEETVTPIVKEAKTQNNNNRKSLYALVAVLMLVIVALVVVIVQDRQPTVAVGNTTLPSNTTSTTLVQETETTTEITTGTTTENAGETLAPVTTTKKAQNSNKETTTKKTTNSSTKETTTKKITTTTTEANEVGFNPTIVYSKDDVYRISIGTADDYYLADVRVENIRKEGDGTMENPTRIHLTTTILKIYKEEYDYDLGETVLQEISKLEFSQIKYRDVFSYDFVLYGYNESGELYSKESIELWCEEGTKFKPGYSFEGDGYVSDDEIDNIVKYCLICE